MAHSSIRSRPSITPTITFNFAFLKTSSGILKLLQLILGICCIGIVGHQFSTVSYYRNTTELFFLLITTTFMIGTFIILLSFLSSATTATIMSKTIYEILYNSIAFGLLLAASLTLLINNNDKQHRNFELLLGASICGLVNAALYFCSTIIALRSYKGH